MDRGGGESPLIRDGLQRGGGCWWLSVREVRTASGAEYSEFLHESLAL